ncbi:unnamed protein product [Closterium sp. NIES-53]
MMATRCGAAPVTVVAVRGNTAARSRALCVVVLLLLLPSLAQSAQLQWLTQHDLPVSCAQNDSSWYCASWDQCVSSDQLCDGLADCNDESDELPWECGGYEEGCPPDMIACPVTTISDKLWCIDPAAACDGSADCPFGADEWPGFCVNFTSKATCPDYPNQVLCPDGQTCGSGMVCDGVADCPSVSGGTGSGGGGGGGGGGLGGGESGGLFPSDEDQDFCAVYECPDGYWKCGNVVQCIAETLKCNGVQDCSDGSDETDCSGSAGGDSSTDSSQDDTTSSGADTSGDDTSGGGTAGPSDGSSGDVTGTGTGGTVTGGTVTTTPVPPTPKQVPPQVIPGVGSVSKAIGSAQGAVNQAANGAAKAIGGIAKKLVKGGSARKKVNPGIVPGAGSAAASGAAGATSGDTSDATSGDTSGDAAGDSAGDGAGDPSNDASADGSGDASGDSSGGNSGTGSGTGTSLVGAQSSPAGSSGSKGGGSKSGTAFTTRTVAEPNLTPSDPSGTSGTGGGKRGGNAVGSGQGGVSSKSRKRKNREGFWAWVKRKANEAKTTVQTAAEKGKKQGASQLKQLQQNGGTKKIQGKAAAQANQVRAKVAQKKKPGQQSRKVQSKKG